MCGETRGIARQMETWWWNEEVAALVKEKQRLFKLWKGPKKCRIGCRCRKTGGQQLCRRGRKVGMRGVARTWKQGDRTITWQRLLLRELSSRQKVMSGRS